MSTDRPRRSALYMPGSSPRALEKARTLDADVLLLDLEDAVAPAAKEEARRLTLAAVVAGGYGQRELVIRVNGAATPWGAGDLAAAARSGADAVLLPKVESAEEVTWAERALRAAGAPEALALWAMVETPRGVLAAPAIAAANLAFAPSVEEVEAARRILVAHAEAESFGKGVVVVDGRLVEALHVEAARRLLALAGAIAARA